MRKDSLYCDSASSTRRRAARSVLDRVFDCLTAWLAPFICFTAEEAWLDRNPGDEESVHLRLFPEIPDTWRNDALAAKWDRIRELRRVVTGAIEVERAEKRIGSSLEAHAEVFAADADIEVLGGIDLMEIAITSGVTLSHDAVPADAFTIDDVAGVGVGVRRAEGQKCARCWKVLDEVGTDADHPDVCGRCANAVRHFQPPSD